MPESTRVINGSVTKGSTTVSLEVDAEPGTESRVIRDGHYIQDYNQLQSSTMRYIRSNVQDTVFIGKKDISSGPYDDEVQFQNFTSSSLDSEGNQITTISKIFMGSNQGRMTTLPSHRIRQFTYGQTDLYDDDEPFYENTNPEDPVEIITTHPYSLHLPKSLVDHSSVSALDGVLEPLISRSSIDLSTIDFPYTAFGIRSSIGDTEGPRRRTSFIVEGYDASDEGRLVPFLDAIEGMGPVSFPTIIPDLPQKISPFVDTAHYRELYYKKESKKGITVSTDMSNTITSGSFRTWDMDPFEKHLSFGSDYETGPDSIVFGGLKK